jgi:hypothetical protein
MNKFLSLMFLVFGCLIGTQSIAQITPPPLLEKHYGSVIYISGGIGDEERDEIQLRGRDFNLKLLFSERDGSYLGEVDVLLFNAKGETVLDAKSEGPFLLVQLPGGSYGIKVSANGLTQERRLSITAKGKHESIFRW